MGVMQTFRQRMPVVVFTLAIAFILLMVAGDFFGRGGGSTLLTGASTALATVNGEPIDGADYEKRVEQATEYMRAQNPDKNVDDAQIRDQVFSEMVDEMLIRQAAQRFGVTVSDAELREAILYDPPPVLQQAFTDSTGNFNKSMYYQFMNDPDAFLSQRNAAPEDIKKTKEQIYTIQEGVRQQRLRDAVKSVVASTAVPAPKELRQAFDVEHTKLSGTYAYLPISLISDSAVSVSDEEARKYYDSHRTEFQRKPSREVSYVRFPIIPSASDSSAIMSRLQRVLESVGAVASPSAKDSIFKSYVDRYGAGRYTGEEYTSLADLSPEMQNAVAGSKPGDIIGPIRTGEGTFLLDVVDEKDTGKVHVRAQHILLRTGTGSEDSVRAMAEKIAQRARSGEDFASLAQRYSADPGSAQKGGDLGYFGKGQMVKPFEEAAFSASVGSIVGPIKTDFGYHIIKVNDRTSKSYRLRDLRFDVRVSNRTKNLLKSQANQFVKQVDDGTPFDSAAAHQDLQLMKSGPIQRNQKIAGTGKLAQFAYDNDEGDISDPIETNDGGFLVAVITDVNTAGVSDFESVKDEIVQKLTQRKKVDRLEARANKLASAAKGIDSLQALKSVDPEVQVQSFENVTPTSPFQGVGYDYPLMAAALKVRPGTVSDAIRGERGYYVVRIKDRVEPTDQEWEKQRASYMKQAITGKQDQLFQSWLQSERQQADIEDNRR